MAFSFAPATREVLEQVVREPRFRSLTTLPLFAPMEVGLVLGAYALFALGSWAWLVGMLPWWAMWLVNGFAIYASFTPLHDATHRTVSSSRSVNDLIGTISCGLLLPGITTAIYRYLHLEHHRYAGDPARDPDEPFVSASPLKLPLVLAFLDVLWTSWYVRHWHARPIAERREFVGAIAFYIGFHVFWLLSPWALEFIMVWMVPQRIGLTAVAWFFAHVQHPRDVRWEDAPFQTTVRIDALPWTRWLLLGQAKHCIHHLAPSVPYYRYHRAWDLGRELFEAQHVPVRTLWSPVRDLQLPRDPQTAREPAWLEARVAEITRVAADVRGYELVPAAGDRWPDFSAGSHVDVELKQGLVRQYSLCNAPGETERYRIAVRLDEAGRGGSRHLHYEVRRGDRLRISRPRNNFRLDEAQSDYVLIAGGIGITPLLAMAYRLHALDKSFTLHQCARNRAAVAFADEQPEFPFADHIMTWLDDAAFDQRFDMARATGAYRAGRQLYVCGPAGFMRAVMDRAAALGWPQEALFSETFVPPQVDAAENRPFEVELRRSGRVLQVPADAFLIDVLHDNGCGVMCSCTQGICGSCLTPVLEGEVDHRDAILTDAERAANDQMTVCVSRARGERLVLDL